MHISVMNVPHKPLNQLAYSFDLSHNRLDTRYSIINITQENIAAVLGLTIAGKNLFLNIFYESNFGVLSSYFCVIEIFFATFAGPCYPEKINFQEFSEVNKEVVRNFQGKTLSQLSTSMMEMTVDGEKN
ncbi:hypothetical protein AHAS_Ahas11G0234000 [Arachis hypogaea]